MQPGYPKTQVNPAIFKPVNLGLKAGKNPGLWVYFWVSISRPMQYKIANNSFYMYFFEPNVKL